MERNQDEEKKLKAKVSKVVAWLNRYLTCLSVLNTDRIALFFIILFFDVRELLAWLYLLSYFSNARLAVRIG